MTIIYQDTNKTISVDQEYIEGVQPRIETITYVGQPDPDPAELIVNITDGDPVSQRILDKIADFKALAAQVDGFTVTSGNAVATLQRVVDEIGDIALALVWLANNQIKSR
jgi:hypothetical protein